MSHKQFNLDDAGFTRYFGAERLQEIGGILRLTPRQLLVAQLLLNGHTYRTVAEHTGLSVHTVRMHIRRLYERLGTSDRVGLVLAFLMADRQLGESLRVTCSAPTLA